MDIDAGVTVRRLKLRGSFHPLNAMRGYLVVGDDRRYGRTGASAHRFLLIDGLDPSTVGQVGEVGDHLSLRHAVGSLELSLDVTYLDRGSLLTKLARRFRVPIVEVPQDLPTDFVVWIWRLTVHDVTLSKSVTRKDT